MSSLAALKMNFPISVALLFLLAMMGSSATAAASASQVETKNAEQACVRESRSYSGGLLCRLIIRDIGLQVAPFSALVKWRIVTKLTS